MADISVPVIVDAVRSHGDFKMIRCTYFTVECDNPSTGWSLTSTGRPVPFLMLGLSGILYYPGDYREYFESARDIDDLFSTIEDDPALFVDTNDVWLPLFLFVKDSSAVLSLSAENMRGRVYRIAGKLFSSAFSFRNGTMSADDFRAICERSTDSLWFSEIETGAFAAWEKEHIELARQRYREDPERQLPRKILD